MSQSPDALWHEGPRTSAIRAADLGSGDALVRTKFSLISRGTERLVFEGRVPPSEFERMRAPMQEGDFPFPVKYGYAAVGVVEDGPDDLVGRHVFSLHPHQTRFRAPSTSLTPLPVGLDPRRAALAANMETALNALWDAGSGPGDRIAVVGAGLVGCLTARLAALLPGADVTLIDVIDERRHVASQLNVSFACGEGLPRACDQVFHTSVSNHGLNTALGCLGDEGTLVEMSWYGAGEIPVALGGAFHSQRLKIVSSQVGKVSPSRRPRWDYARRLSKALQLCDDPALDHVITDEVAFADLPVHIGDILAPGAPGVATLVTYD